MRRLMNMAVLFAAIGMLATSCGEKTDDGGSEKPAVAAPTITLDGADIDKAQEIVSVMKVKVNVDVPGSVQDFSIRIESPCLTEEVLNDMGLATTMNLVTPATQDIAAGLTQLGFPVGDKAKNAKTLSFDLSEFIPMIALLYDKSSDHKFHLTVTDASSQKVTKTLWFHLTGKASVTYNEDADLWANTASLKVVLAEVTKNVECEYKRSLDADWQKAELTLNAEDGSYTAAITPKWRDEAAHASGAKLFTPNVATGVFAGCTYQYRLMIDGVEVEGASGSFTTDAGAQVPGGNMESWSETMAEGFTGPVTLYAPTKSDGTAFWGNGSNNFTPTLCVPFALDDATKAAKLQGSAMGTIFAAGNLFTGVFEMAGMAGYARFGEEFAFSARPQALRLKYKATIKTVALLNPTEGFPNPIEIDAIDPARIFVCITDWKDRHSVYSGLGVTADKINPFDPEKTLTPAEGAVLAFGSKTIVESVDDWTVLTIPLKWADKTAKPTASTADAKRYSLVISAAASAYGDYLCGNIDNQLYLDNIEWVY